MLHRLRGAARRHLIPSSLALGLAGLGSNGCSCFRAGTFVRTRHGSRRIEELAVGDLVLGYDPVARRLVESAVLRTWIHDDRPLRRLRVGASETYVTAEHPYFVSGSGFRRVDALDPTARLLRWHGSDTLAESVVDAIDEVGERDRVFNLHVAGPSTYFADGHLVHNKSPPHRFDRCDCESSSFVCIDTDLDGDGTRFPDDCDDEDPTVGPCTAGQTRVPLRGCGNDGPDASAHDAGSDAGGPDASFEGDAALDEDGGP